MIENASEVYSSSDFSAVWTNDFTFNEPTVRWLFNSETVSPSYPHHMDDSRRNLRNLSKRYEPAHCPSRQRSQEPVKTASKFFLLFRKRNTRL